jgi:hypothetical protein
MAESQWDQMALQRLGAKLEQSSAFLALMTEKWKEDPNCLLQLGFAMMLDKPILLAVPEGVKVPRALARVADRIEYYRSPEDYELAVERLLKFVAE